MKPVTLVATVVQRNTAVQEGRGLPPIMPKTTTNPLRIPTRLIRTWNKVKRLISIR
jgi:hypothetical protein